jgi:diguanylate cyclase (GGDEF)-like protein
VLCAYAVCFGLVLILVPLSSPVDWTEVGPALGVQAGVGVLLVVEAQLAGVRQTAVGVFAVVAYLASVALVRDGLAPTAGFGALSLLPVTWASLRGRRIEFTVALVGLALVYLVPAALIGPPHYPAGSWRAALLLTVIAAALGGMALELVVKVDGLMARLHDLARTDDLTALPNRRAWCEQLGRALSAAWRTAEPLTVLLIDLDSFKGYNDAHGHLAGDQPLRGISAAWTGILRDVDVLARWGGDEFGLLLPGCDEIQALAVLGRLRAVCPAVPFSAGIAQLRVRDSANELLARADAALYRAKDVRAEAIVPALAV